jgi:hypothetical protein
MILCIVTSLTPTPIPHGHGPPLWLFRCNLGPVISDSFSTNWWDGNKKSHLQPNRTDQKLTSDNPRLAKNRVQKASARGCVTTLLTA